MQSKEFYETKLYPMQDKILNAIDKLSLPFYLTGGTALSRGYLNHRYSDDLDFFVNDDPNFPLCAKKALDAIANAGFSINKENIISSPNFLRILVQSSDKTKLKIDFVNDLPYRNGIPCTRENLLGKIDSLENILTNKLSALIGRNEIKDSVDIWAICHFSAFSWSDVIEKALHKEAMVESGLLSLMLSNASQKDFENISWIKKPSWEDFLRELETISSDILSGNANSLAP